MLCGLRASDEVVLLFKYRFIGMETGVIMAAVEAIMLCHEMERWSGPGAVVESTGIFG